MRFGEKEVEVGELDANQMIRLTKLIVTVFNEIEEDQKSALMAGLPKGKWMAFINVMSPQHLYELTAILLKCSKKESREHWSIISFTDLLAELAEHNDLGAVVKNLQRVVVAFQS